MSEEEQNSIFKNAPIKVRKREDKFDIFRLGLEGIFYNFINIFYKMRSFIIKM
jgi:hypothetical protein